MHYRIGGEGEPLLMLHMTPRSSDEFRELMPLITRTRRAIAPDLMGLGDSDPPPWAYTLSDYAKSIIALLDHHQIEKFTLMGSLTGGYMAGEIAAAFPDRVSHLILCNVFHFDQAETQNIAKRYNTGFKLKEDGSHLIDRWSARVNYIDNEDLNHRCVLEDLKCFESTIYTGLAVANYCPTAPERFGLIQAPTLLLRGDRALEPLEKAGLAKAEHQDWLVDVIPNTCERVLTDGTLWMLNQRPEEIANLVDDFLSTH